MFYFDYGIPNFSSEIYLDYMSIGDSLLNNNSIGLTDIDECDCYIESFTSSFACDSFQSITGQIYYESVTIHDTLNLIGACDSIFTLDISIGSSNTIVDVVYSYETVFGTEMHITKVESIIIIMILVVILFY